MQAGGVSKSILYATYVSPFPTNSGERIRCRNLIAALAQLGYRVEAFVGNYDQVDLAAHDAPGVRYHQIPFAWPRLRQSASVYFRSDRQFVEQVLALHAKQPFSAIFLDYGFMGAHVPAFKAHRIPVIVGTHNVESVLTGLAPKASLGARLGLRLRQRVEAWHEQRFFPRADAVICVSEDDRHTYSRYIAPERLHVVPNFTDIPDIYEHAVKADRIIMSGSFDNFQNREGFRWFVKNVWDRDLGKNLQLCIAGRSSDVAAAEFAHVPGIVGLGACDDLLVEIARSRAAIVPLLHGGGTRLKCIEAMAVRTPVVTTAKGCEGIDHGGTFRVADTPLAFKAAILDVLADRARANQKAAEARAIFDRLFSISANAAALEQALASAAQVRSRRS